jgi:hypothetical protein
MWYSATFIVKCTIGQNQTGNFLFDEQIKIIKAANREEAYEKALKLGQVENHEYKNSDGELVKWTFEGLFNLNSLESLEDGTEIASKMVRADSSEDLIVPKERLLDLFQAKQMGKTGTNIGTI